MINYEQLLRKYLSHVGQCEGTDFTDRLNDCMTGSEIEFTHDEVVVLEHLSKVSRKQEGCL